MPFDPIVLANEVPDEATFDRAVLEALNRDIGFDAAFLAIKGAPATTVDIDAKKLDAAIARDEYADELAPMKAAALAKRGVAVDTQVLGEQRVRTLRYHRELATPIGGRHSLIAFLAVRGIPIGGLMLGRCGTTFSAEQLSLVESLLPRIAIARASFRLPWWGGPLPTPRSTGARRLAEWIRGERIHEHATAHSPELLVRDRAGYREMVAADERGELVWSRAALDEPERSGWFYIDLLHLAAVRASSQRRLLFIGSGGGVSIRQFARVYPGAMLADGSQRRPRRAPLRSRGRSLSRSPVSGSEGAALRRASAVPCHR